MADATAEAEKSSAQRETEATPATATATPAPTTTTASTAPYSSEGPTLPILGTAGDPVVKIPTPAVSRPNEVEAAQGLDRPRKKRKTNNGTPASPNPTSAPPPPPLNPTLEPLRKPWTLLPSEVRAAVEARCGEGFWGGNCVAVVFTRNQNIRAGVNRLKGCLGVGGGRETKGEGEVDEVLGSRGLVVAVSGLGDAAVKVVGVVEVLKRVVGGDGEGIKGVDIMEGVEGNEAETQQRTETWYLYTSLGSTPAASRYTNKNIHKKPHTPDEPTIAGLENKTAEEDDASFEPTSANPSPIDAPETQKSERNAPVLTVWLSRLPIAEFGAEFGEEKFVVNLGVRET
ncbi:hypothetical protein K505DRAFT_5022 [Melanomma pulvis-pyrius CBS 109.77]|uniref:DNA/RNA-binding protein Alba-like domain-containing protein n=1 Tax=Melanomma pulvis-pyrius CBS 109.77 TaxID=1314802 RepID=A0A6A6WP20_9PLEO|nr:hypothetical protein K505DRAFT_5022 [Melanomma pulvis-pyrius CBS 109.77]